MKKSVVIGSVVASFFLKFLQEKTKYKGGYHFIKYKAAKELIDKTNCVILDVRNKKDYINNRLKNAILIYEEDLVRKADEFLKKSDILIVYSDNPVKSKRVCKTLLAMGYGYVFDIGTIDKWPYESVHGNDFKIRKL